MYALDLICEFECEREANIVFNATKPDVKEKHKRSKIEMNIEKNKIKVRISASDATALRASFNSIAKPIMISKKIIDNFGGACNGR